MKRIGCCFRNLFNRRFNCANVIKKSSSIKIATTGLGIVGFAFAKGSKCDSFAFSSDNMVSRTYLGDSVFGITSPQNKGDNYYYAQHIIDNVQMVNSYFSYFISALYDNYCLFYRTAYLTMCYIPCVISFPICFLPNILFYKNNILHQCELNEMQKYWFQMLRYSIRNRYTIYV